MAITYNTYRLGDVASIKFLAIENMPQFSANVFPTGGWIRIPLGPEVDLGPGDSVLYGDAALYANGHSSPTFRPTALAGTPTGPHFTHNPYCRLGSARRAALVAILRTIATRLVMVALCNRADHYIFPVISIFLSSLWSPYVIGQTVIFMAALCNRGGIIFLPCSFFPSFFLLYGRPM